MAGPLDGSLTFVDATGASHVFGALATDVVPVEFEHVDDADAPAALTDYERPEAYIRLMLSNVRISGDVATVTNLRQHPSAFVTNLGANRVQAQIWDQAAGTFAWYLSPGAATGTGLAYLPVSIPAYADWGDRGSDDVPTVLVTPRLAASSNQWARNWRVLIPTWRIV